MIRQQAKERIKKLKKIITHHRYLYHVIDKQEISDAALDSLKKELFDLEQKFPEFITLDSPTQRLGGKPLKKFKKVRHFQPMLSFNDAFSKKDIEDWLTRLKKLLSPEQISQVDFFCELKIDGLAIELIYKDGIFKTGLTRGDGQVGEDVTQNLKTIEVLPLSLHALPSKLNVPRFFIVRGEVFIPKKEFEKLNKEQIKKGLSPYANPRNVAAGSIRQLDSKITASRCLDFYAYDLIGIKTPSATHWERHKILKNLGFKINPYNRYCKNLEEVFAFHQYWKKNRKKLAYEIDGIVIIINNNKIFEKLGVVGKAPRASIAYKFPFKENTTIVEDIRIQIGRTGALTPVAYLKSVKIGGATISRVTLHNQDEIKRLGIRIGDTVIVGRAGDVIPAIIRVLPELRIGRGKEFLMPKKCPACFGKITKPKGEAISRCQNPKCFARLKKNFYHFVSKKAIDIVGLGPKIIEKIIDQGIISDPADLFELEVGDILSLPGFGQKSAENLIKAIQIQKKISLSRFIYALGIRNVGEETANDLAHYFKSIEKLRIACLKELIDILDIGPVTAKNIYQWFRDEKNLKFLGKIEKAGIEIQKEVYRPKFLGKKFEGKTFVWTGNLETLTRAEAQEKIRNLGGKVSEFISSKINYLVVGENPGSKFEKAKKLGIKIIKEKNFLEMIA